MSATAGLHRLPTAVYNLGPAGDRHAGQVRRERLALANDTERVDGRRRRPKVIGYIEAIGHRLDKLDHYQPTLHDTSRESRANVALDVSAGLTVTDAYYLDHKATWPKVNDPHKRHAPRSGLVVELLGPADRISTTVIVDHAPQAPNRRLPDATNAALVAARAEWLEDLAEFLDKRRLVVLLDDSNALNGRLADAIAGRRHHVFGSPIEGGIVKGYTVEADALPERLNGVRFLSDHGKANLTRLVTRPRR